MEVRIDGWKCNLTFSSAHFLADYSKCSRLHGHTYAVNAQVEGKIHDGIVVDFKVLKDAIKDITEELDHKIIIPTKGKFQIKTLEGLHEPAIEVAYGDKKYVFPTNDCVFLPLYSSSAELLAAHVLEQLRGRIDTTDIERITVGVDEGYGQGAWTEWKKKRSV
jgi:6-pyruvoyltetrahydropterin/6-carboxytetrahydropterin synthase